MTKMRIENIIGDGIGYLELQDIMGDDLAIVNAARVSYLGESKGKDKDKKLLNYLWSNKHTSPFEMTYIKLKVHCPLFVRSQWHRHRTFSYNEVSRRYTSENLEFYYPNQWRSQDNKNRQGSIEGDFRIELSQELKVHCLNCVDYYNNLLNDGVVREMARMVLPQNLYTTFIASGNLRNWLHFIGLRSDDHAQWEIRQYSDKILDDVVKEYFPWVYGILKKERVYQDGKS